MTATLPLCEIIATGPARSAWTESPQSAERAPKLTTPLPFGPQTGNPVSAAASRSDSSSPRPPSTSPKPAETTTAPPQPRRPTAEITSGTPAAGIATATASTASGRSPTVGTHSIPRTSLRRGLTPQRVPS